ncbi:MAG TPA: hypothetical protein ENG78_02415 [Acidiferrobacteraceae bacterium]|nr:hypothetical protein [Acidiferrobacteraceae bacterium]HEX19662.1 hypothetical protein [Acidiferrobacteraceae bacterium]
MQSMSFYTKDLYPGSRIGDTVRVQIPPLTIRDGFRTENYMLTSYCSETDKWVGELIDYVELAKARIRKQVYF